MIPDIFVHGSSGNLMNLRAIHPSEITVPAIAHTLSLKNRWDARTIKPWSVLQHSLFLSVLVPSEFAKQALSHDFVEGFIPDFPYPIMAAYPDLARLQEHVWEQVQEVLDLEDLSPEVDYADRVTIREIELRHLFPSLAGDARPHPYFDFLVDRNPAEVRSIFMEKWRRACA